MAGASGLRDLCDLYGVSDPGEREHLAVLAREGKGRAWWQFDLPYATYVGLEAEAISISDYGAGVFPGSCRRLTTPASSMRRSSRPFHRT